MFPLLGKNPTVRAICTAYLDVKKDPHAFKKCLVPMSIDYSLRRIVREWGDMPIDTFNKGTTERIEKAYSRWLSEKDPRTKRPTKSGTIRKGLSLFKAACQFAVKRELITRNQVPIFDLPPTSPPRERVLTQEELGRLIQAAKESPSHVYVQAIVLPILGCRVGAFRALEWSMVDFENRVIRLRDTQSAEDRARNKKRREDQPMSDFLYEILMDAKLRAKSDFVVEWRGKGCGRTYAGMKALFKRAGLPDLRIHDLRRSSATFIHKATGGDLQKAATHIGDTVEMARKHYVHAEVGLKRDGIDMLSDMVREAAKSA